MLTISLSAFEPQSGKDTLAYLLKTHFEAQGKTVKIIAFGDALRKHVAGMFDTSAYPTNMLKLMSPAKDSVSEEYAIKNVRKGYSEYQYFMAVTKEFDPEEPRSLRFHMQHYGTDFIREFKQLEHHWIEVVTSTMADWAIEDVDVVIVTDTRFPAEFDVLKFLFQADFMLVNPVGFPPSAYQKEDRPVHKAETFSRNFEYTREVSNHYGFPNDMLKQLEGQGFLSIL
ncbi:MAG: hypothetical protein ACRDCE_20220 [Cetobacterium sp.]|uniref:deoxynucleotide monophosphate kinase family protein n=1 Tax=Cetobacterium sp. TaxID=2071632 RepID=UPI003EE70D9F